MSADQQSIRVSRTITIVSTVLYNPDYYPGMTLEQAVEYERNLPLLDKIENFTEELAFVSTDDPLKFRFSENIEIVKDEDDHE